jgi:16S rRNA (guanine1516-N2)-methyltransferase
LGVQIRADFYGGTVTYRVQKGGGRGQMIAKAVGLKQAGLRVYDLTAGLGSDAFVLASLGCSVGLCERHPVVRALLEAAYTEALDFAHAAIERKDLLSSLERMQLLEGDAETVLAKLSTQAQPDVIYLDPMFPKRTKHALVKKEMQVLQGLVGPDADADGLLELALACAKKRVVVKRPKLAPNLADQVPSHVLTGKANRFDIYMI